MPARDRLRLCCAVLAWFRVLKAEGDALRAVEREKQREMLKDLKEKSKADKENQKQVGTGLS
jgi:alkylated DNA nucleotide flippase Atl1